ncbi:hypothetical protein [Roseovarius sp. Pro17]|uniref:hypothetical protein n=1 Tax=Roseovarius sp. Pro17 TaxID=3108175 RepID=UPI002D79860A|nr:hypothetical protein [Roseovarius sp. Pro17]
MIKQLLLATALTSVAACDAYAGEALTRFDVAEDHTRFVFADKPVHESGMPAHGNPFVTQGYIYPADTLAGNIDGVLEDGSPAFPDKVLGTWTCDGWFVGEGGDAKTGVWLVSRQIMQFDNGDVVITQGTELADAGVTNTRPITGATGDYAEFDDVMLQTLIGFTSHFGVNATFEIPQGEDHAYAN